MSKFMKLIYALIVISGFLYPTQNTNCEELTIKALLGGTISQPADLTSEYINGEEVVIQAVPEPGYYFTGWTGDGSEHIASSLSELTTVIVNDEVSLNATFSPIAGIKIQNGNFTNNTSAWTPWTVNGNTTIEVTEDSGSLTISGNDFNGGVYQQFKTGGIGKTITVTGHWQSDTTNATNPYAEILIINSDRTPIDGTDEISDNIDVIRLFRNTDPFGWSGAIPHNTPDNYQISFIADSDKATILLKAGNDGEGNSSVTFDNIEVRSIPSPATTDNLPTGFEHRTLTFPTTGMDRLAEHPLTHDIYAIRDFGDRELYKIDVTADPLRTELVAEISEQGIEFDSWASGLAFDPQGNLFIISHDGDLLLGTYLPDSDSYEWASFLDINDTYDIENVGDHGFGGLALDPVDQTLYINYGAIEHGDGNEEPEPDNGLNTRILRVNLDGSDFGVFCEGIRHCFGITLRADGSLFGVENSTDCHSAERFLFFEEGNHYGFPYAFGSDRSGNDTGLFTCEETPIVKGPFTPAMANYGPDARPNRREPGYIDGGTYWGFHPHSSPNDVDFYNPSLMDPDAILFPEEYHGRAFVVRFGQQISDSPDVGYDILSLRLDEANGSFVCNTFLSEVGRLIDVLCHSNGKVYFIAYTPTTTGPSTGSGNSILHEISYTIPSGVKVWNHY